MVVLVRLSMLPAASGGAPNGRLRQCAISDDDCSLRPIEGTSATVVTPEWGTPSDIAVLVLTTLGDAVIDLNVPFNQQSFEFDCWYASLRMLVKFRDGVNAEPNGHPVAELAGMARQSERTGVREDTVRQQINPATYTVRKQLQLIPSRGLKQDEFDDLAGFNGLVAPKLPPRDVNAKTGGWTADQLESLLRLHGPLWCALGYGHIVVLKGINAHGQAVVHDPQGNANTPYDIPNFNNLLTWRQNSVMFLPNVPNADAINPR